VVDPNRSVVIKTWKTDVAPRDLIWFDPGRPGPLLPMWSDQGGGPEGVELNQGKK